MHYRLVDGLYHLARSETTIYKGKEVAVAFSHDGVFAVMHTHGSPSVVRAWLQDAQNTIRQTSFPEFADEFHMIVSDQWNVDDLNNILNNTSFLDRFLSRHKLLETA